MALIFRAGRAAWTSFLLPSCTTTGRTLRTGGVQTPKEDGREEAVVVTDDGKTVVCWHPEPQVPYALTKPLPERSPESDSVLGVQSLETKKLFQSRHPYFINKELRELTFTTKHRWFPKPGKRYAKKNAPRDREYM